MSCAVCASANDERGNEILLCDGCDAAFHMRCLRPMLTTVPPGDWFCVKCASRRRKSAEWQASEREERGRGGRKPKQRNGYLLDMYGESTGECYACRVSKYTVVQSKRL